MNREFMIEVGKGVFGFVMIGALLALMYVGLGAVCVSMHGVAACSMEASDE